MRDYDDMKGYRAILKGALAAPTARLSPTGTIASMQEALESVKPCAVNYEYVINSSSEVMPGTVRITITEPDFNHKPRNMYYPKLSGIIILCIFMISVVLGTIFL